LIGQQLAHFKILDLLGEGGMGAVYRAEDTKLGREVAVKVLPEAFVADAERLARFEREAKVLASLDHPNIAGIYEVGQHEEVHFLAMQLAPGDDLANLLTRETPDLESSLAISLQIATALEAAHERGIVHRDLKPANVKVATNVGSGVTVKVLDFGLAKAWDDGPAADGSLSMSPTLTAQMTQAGVILGTAGYMSPEQARGQEADARADIWSFGVMLWEMVTGERLFQEDTVSDTLAAVLKTQIDLDKLPEDLPKSIHRLVSRCLERDVRNRLQAIGEARIAIEGFLADPDAAEPGLSDEVFVEAPSRPSSLRRWAPIAVAALTAGLVANIITRELRPEAPEPPVRRFEVLAEGFREGRGVTPVISPDGTMIAYPSEGGITIRDLDRLEPRVLDNAEDARLIIWSPDSRHLAYQTTSNKIHRLDLARGGTRLVAASPEGRRALHAAWLSDDRILLGLWRRNVYGVSANGGEPEVVLDLESSEDDVDVHWFLKLPEDHGVLALLHRQAEWSLVCLRGDERIEVEEIVFPYAYTEDGRLIFDRENDGNLWAAAFDPAALTFTGEPILVASNVGWASYSQDGTLIYGIDLDDRQRVPVRVNRQGEILETFGDPVANLEKPTMSPDGRFLVAEYQAESADVNNIFVYDLQRSVWTRLTSVETDQGYPSWSADGEQIYFRNGSMVAMIRRDGVGGAQDLFQGTSPQPSSDGRTLLFMTEADLMSIDLGEDGLPIGEPVVVQGPEPGKGSRGDVSPDGRFLIYGSDESGTPEIYLTEFPEARSRWQVSRSGGVTPLWSPDGDSISYYSRGTLWEVPFELQGQTPQLGNAAPLFEDNLFAAMGSGVTPLPDGTYMTVQAVREGRAQYPTIVVVENVLSELDP
jgi:serine/threonine-protein kinase